MPGSVRPTATMSNYRHFKMILGKIGEKSYTVTYNMIQWLCHFLPIGGTVTKLM